MVVSEGDDKEESKVAVLMERILKRHDSARRSVCLSDSS